MQFVIFNGEQFIHYDTINEKYYLCSDVNNPAVFSQEEAAIFVDELNDPQTSNESLVPFPKPTQ